MQSANHYLKTKRTHKAMKPPFTEKVNCTYGAPMGRPEYLPRHYNGERLHLRRVPLNSGGYDPGGAYWGTGLPLYCAYGHTDCETGEPVELYMRALDRDDAAYRVALACMGRTAVQPQFKR